MDRRLAEKLATCLELIEQEGKSITEVVRQFPEHAEELQQLLATVQYLERQTDISPRPEFRAAARTRLQNRIAAQQTTFRKPAVTFSQPGRLKPRKQQTIHRRFSMSWFIIIATVVSLVLGGGGAAYASTDALPGDGLYPVKTAVQDIMLTLNGDEGDLELLLEFMDGNLNEMNQLIEQGRWDDIALGLDEYLENMAQTRKRLSYLDAPSEEALNTRLQQELHLQSQELLKLQIKLQDRDRLQNKVQEAIQLTEQGNTYGPSEGGSPEEGGSPNGPGPGEPNGMQQQGDGQPDDAGGPGNDSSPGNEGCGQQNGAGSETTEQDSTCGQSGEGSGSGGQGNGNGQGGKP